MQTQKFKKMSKKKHRSKSSRVVVNTVGPKLSTIEKLENYLKSNPNLSSKQINETKTKIANLEARNA